MDPIVVTLQLHLKDKQLIAFKDLDSLENVAKNKFLLKIMLTEFFVTNAHSEYSRKLLYKEFSEHYIWNRNDRK